MSDTILTINPAEFKHIPLFSSVSIFDVEDILLKCPLLRIDEGRVIIAAGQPNERLYIVLRGTVSVRLDSLDAPPVAHLARGDVFGELSVIDGDPPPHSWLPKSVAGCSAWTATPFGSCFAVPRTSPTTCSRY